MLNKIPLAIIDGFSRVFGDTVNGLVALVGAFVAVFAGPALSAGACVAFARVFAFSVDAWLVLAVVDCYFALLAGEAFAAQASRFIFA